MEGEGQGRGQQGKAEQVIKGARGDQSEEVVCGTKQCSGHNTLELVDVDL
jgi:hypothetical protein